MSKDTSLRKLFNQKQKRKIKNAQKLSKIAIKQILEPKGHFELLSLKL